MTSTADAGRGEPAVPIPPDDLVTAGRFATLTLLSAKALRIYADRDLLPPRWTDPHNGYRYYAPDQVRTGWLIGLLRSAQLSLDEIGVLLSTDGPDALRLLDDICRAQTRRFEADQAVLDRVRLHLGEESAVPTTSIDTVLETDQPVLSVLRRMTPQQMDDVITDQLAVLRRIAASAGLSPFGDAFGIFHAPITDESDGPLEIVLPVDGLTELAGAAGGSGDPDTGGVRSYRLPGGLLARRHAEGPETFFPEILALYDELHSWITDSGRVPVGPPREIWHNSPRDPEPLRLTIAWPYAPGR